MVLGTFILALIVLFDRILMSVAKDPVSASLSLNDKQMGWVMSIFALGYALFQTPAGLFADKYGPRKVLAAVVTLWSFFTALTGAVWNYTVLLIVRFLFGAGEAGAFPGIARATYSWIPIKERGIVNGINFSGGRIGAAIALPVVAWMIEWTGWRMTFLILGVFGVLWGIFWYAWFRDQPGDHAGMSEEEVAHIKELTEESSKDDSQKISFRALFRSKQMWLLMGQYFASNFTFFFCLTWLFPHIKAKYNLDAVEAGFYASAPLIFGTLGNWFSGFLVDYLYKVKNLRVSRRSPAIIGFVLASTGLIASIYMTEVTGAVVFISIAVFGADMTLSPSWTTCVDVGRQFSGAVSGTMNMAGNIGSFLTALAFPYLLAFTGTEVPFFFLAAGLNTIAIFLWLGIRPSKPLEIKNI